MRQDDTQFLTDELGKLRRRIQLLEQENAFFRSALSETEERLSTLIAAVPDLLCFKDQYGRWVETNAATLGLLGLSNCEYKGKTDAELIKMCKKFPNILDQCTGTDNRVWLTGEQVKSEVEIDAETGKIITFEMVKAPIYYPDGSPKAIIMMGRDVTDRKEIEKRLRLILENAPVMMIAVDESGNFVAWNKECERVTGFSDNEIIHNPAAYSLLFPEAAYRQYVVRLFLSKDTGFRDLELAFTCKDGTVKTISWFSIADRFPVAGWKLWTFGVDITGRKQMEDLLKRQQKEFKSLAENSPDVIIRFDRNFNYLYINQVIVRYTNIEPAAYIGKSLGEIEPSADYEATVKTWKYILTKVLKTGKATTIESDIRMPPGSGQLFSYHARFIPEFDDNEQVESVLCIIQDTTEKKLLERELGRLERLNVVGEMAAGIGHEVRNPMTTVRGFLQLLNKKADCRKYAEYYTVMIGELDRANSIITEFLALAKNKAINKELCNINESIRIMVPLLEADGLMANKYIKTRLAEIPEIPVDQKEIRQLLLNLVRNAMEAMPAGGTVTIETYCEGGNVVLAVKDEGNGIHPDIVDKLGTPFFTTKEQGTGLGLAVCYSIAQRHQATIKYDTGAGGTTFFVAFCKSGQE